MVSATVGVIISIICSVITLDCSEVLPDDKAHLIVLPVASTTCKSGSGRWQAAALLRRANHDKPFAAGTAALYEPVASVQPARGLPARCWFVPGFNADALEPRDSYPCSMYST